MNDLIVALDVRIGLGALGCYRVDDIDLEETKSVNVAFSDVLWIQ